MCSEYLCNYICIGRFIPGSNLIKGLGENCLGYFSIVSTKTSWPRQLIKENTQFGDHGPRRLASMTLVAESMIEGPAQMALE